ncbi:MAG: hypothetical protein HSCHL_0592 [Hydrogenibacillus schlegelii]|uniref:Uncharacterized protein n=1 Tax=Hydrogenibacillus schlegelii TaxID=1484 RepID=A0A2T5GDP6_HYDSH|nr:MAG: hypothetical protein HSCHL_0592 [Hydrogenibacillus schlegelii]
MCPPRSPRRVGTIATSCAFVHIIDPCIASFLLYNLRRRKARQSAFPRTTP